MDELAAGILFFSLLGLLGSGYLALMGWFDSEVARRSSHDSTWGQAFARLGRAEPRVARMLAVVSLVGLVSSLVLAVLG